MTSSINNFTSPYFTNSIRNDLNESDLQAEIDDINERLDNDYYTKLESDARYLHQGGGTGSYNPLYCELNKDF